MRTKEILLSDEEHRQLTNFKEESYPEHTPFGYIVGEIVKEVRDDD